jgi:hypothetical protein
VCGTTRGVGVQTRECPFAAPGAALAQKRTLESREMFADLALPRRLELCEAQLGLEFAEERGVKSGRPDGAVTSRNPEAGRQQLADELRPARFHRAGTKLMLLRE